MIKEQLSNNRQHAFKIKNKKMALLKKLIWKNEVNLECYKIDGSETFGLISQKREIKSHSLFSFDHLGK
jgi:hypothetical protein